MRRVRAAHSARRGARDPRETQTARTGTGALPRWHRILPSRRRRTRQAAATATSAMKESDTMTDGSSVAKNLRDRLSGTTEERLGRALSDLLENPLLTGAIGRAFDAREKASQAQE